MSRIADLAKITRTAELGNAVSTAVMTSWIAEMPATRRSEWLVDRLTAALDLRWADEPATVEGPIRLPRSDRERIEKRFEQLWQRCIDQHDDEPEPSEYADVLDEELARIGSRHEAFAVRLLTGRFADRSGALTLTFRKLLDRKQLAKPDKILRLLEQKLEIEWD